MDNTNEIEMFLPEEMHVKCNCPRQLKKLIPSETWDEQDVLLYNLDAIIAVGFRDSCRN